MSADDHRDTMLMVLNCARILACVDVEQAVNNANRSLAVGPLFQPTAWIEKHKALEEDLEVLKAALPLYRLAKKLREKGEDG